MKLRNIKELTYKELKTYLDNISGYLILTLFLALVYYFFLQGFFIAGVASVREMFALMPWYLTLLVPAVTMGAFAAERDKQTIEYIITKPLKAHEILLGKVLGASKFIIIGLLLTLPLPLFVSTIGSIDWGETLAGYLGTIILIITLVSIGVTISSFFKSQISAFITTAIIILSLNIIGSSLVSINLSTNLANFLASLSITEHYYSITRGVLDLNDLLYYFLIILIANTITYVVIRNIRYNQLREAFSTSLITILVVSFFALAIYYSAGSSYGRVDITSSRKYTLSDVTKGILNRENKVIVNVYASSEMPYEYQFRMNELKNILSDYDRSGRDLLEVNYLDAGENEEKLRELGIPPVEFRTFGKDQLQVNQGYLAVVIQNESGEKQETIPFVNDVNNLEYDLSTRIYKIKSDEKTKVAFAGGNGERSIYGEYSLLNALIENDIQVETVNFRAAPVPEGTEISSEESVDLTITNPEGNPTTTESADTPLPDLSAYELLVIANPTNDYDEESKNLINDFINNGGKVIYLVDMKDVDLNTPELGAATPVGDVRGKLLANYGVSLANDMLYDLVSHLNLSISSGDPTMPVIPYPYPLFPVAGDAQSMLIPNMPSTIALAWPSTIITTEDTKDQWTQLYYTTPYAGTKTDENIDPRQEYSEENLSQYPVAITRKLDNGSILVMINTARIFDNDFLQNYRDNALFATTLFDYMAEGVGFSNIQAKALTSSRFSYIEDADRQLIRYGAPILSFVMLGGIALYRVIRRKRMIAKYSIVK